MFNYCRIISQVNYVKFCKLKVNRRLTTATTKDTDTKDKDEFSSRFQEDETHFGFQKVKASEKEQKVHEIFDNVAKNYDIMNDVMSMGVHRFWKDYFIDKLAPTRGTKLLDMAGGTGDIAFRFLKYIENQPFERNKESLSGHEGLKEMRVPETEVMISDINQDMLNIGMEKAKHLGYTEERLEGITINWVCADAEKLPFENNFFTAYTIAFGIRNCTHINKVLSEAYRVLKPGGCFMCLEFSHLNNETLQYLYDTYSFQVIPPMGQIIAGQWEAYQYLVESIRKFPKQEEFKKMIREAGFKCVNYENLTFGVVSIHSGFKL